jgi:hypothetical protein
MTRCPEYYDKWAKDPNWCGLCKSAVSHINRYLEWVDLLEEAGVPRKLTMVKLPERVARHLFKFEKMEEKQIAIMRLALHLKDPNTKNLNETRLQQIISLGIPPKAPKAPTIEKQIRQNDKKIAEYEKRIHALKQENETLNKELERESAAAPAPVLQPAVNTADVVEETDAKPIVKGKNNIVGIDAVKAKLAGEVIAK